MATQMATQMAMSTINAAKMAEYLFARQSCRIGQRFLVMAQGQLRDAIPRRVRRLVDPLDAHIGRQRGYGGVDRLAGAGRHRQRRDRLCGEDFEPLAVHWSRRRRNGSGGERACRRNLNDIGCACGGDGKARNGRALLIGDAAKLLDSADFSLGRHAVGEVGVTGQRFRAGHGNDRGRQG
jgi:hypothetical protein